MVMQLFEWAVVSKASGTRSGIRSVGITDAADTAQVRMIEMLDSINAGQLAKGWITNVSLSPDRLTYDRLRVVARVIKDRKGELQWESNSNATALASAQFTIDKMVTIDGNLLQRMRHGRGLSRETLAWTAGLGITTLARLEGQPRPRCRYQTLARLATVLGENPRAITTGAQVNRGRGNQP
jgi:hypothetical protein